MNRKRIYVASSWRNEYQPTVVAALREAGHEVYDFKNPAEDNNGFHWSTIDPEWKEWTPAKLKQALGHPVAQKGWGFDQRAMEWANAGVLVLPSGNSAHLEAGWLAGKGKPTCVYVPAMKEPDLMYNTFNTVQKSFGLETFCLDMYDVLYFLKNSLGDYA